MEIMEYNSNGVFFRWSGGQYIDVFFGGCESPTECINIINQKGEREFEFGDWNSFIAECEEWMNG